MKRFIALVVIALVCLAVLAFVAFLIYGAYIGDRDCIIIVGGLVGLLGVFALWWAIGELRL